MAEQPKNKGIRPQLFVLSLILTAVVFTIVGVLMAPFVMPANWSEDLDLISDDTDMQWLSYSSTKYQIAFEYPDGWEVLEDYLVDGDLYNVVVHKQGHYLVFIKPGNWEPEPCYYKDQVTDFTEEQRASMQFVENFDRVSAMDAEYRVSSSSWMSTDSKVVFDICYHALEGEIFTQQVPGGGLARFIVPNGQTSTDTLEQMKVILASLTETK